MEICGLAWYWVIFSSLDLQHYIVLCRLSFTCSPLDLFSFSFFHLTSHTFFTLSACITLQLFSNIVLLSVLPLLGSCLLALWQKHLCILNNSLCLLPVSVQPQHCADHPVFLLQPPVPLLFTFDRYHRVCQPCPLPLMVVAFHYHMLCCFFLSCPTAMFLVFLFPVSPI